MLGDILAVSESVLEPHKVSWEGIKRGLRLCLGHCMRWGLYLLTPIAGSCGLQLGMSSTKAPPWLAAHPGRCGGALKWSMLRASHHREGIYFQRGMRTLLVTSELELWFKQ